MVHRFQPANNIQTQPESLVIWRANHFGDAQDDALPMSLTLELGLINSLKRREELCDERGNPDVRKCQDYLLAKAIGDPELQTLLAAIFAYTQRLQTQPPDEQLRLL